MYNLERTLLSHHPEIIILVVMMYFLNYPLGGPVVWMGATLGIVQIFCVREATFVLLLRFLLLFFLTPHPVLCACALTSVCLRCAGDAGCFPRLITTLIPAPWFCFFFFSFFSSTPPPPVWKLCGHPPDCLTTEACRTLLSSYPSVLLIFSPPPPPLPSLFVEFHLSSTFLRSDGEGGASEGAEI